MKIIAIISQKGGAGKTTLAVHLAAAAVAAGFTAAVIDLDPQGTAASWGDRRTVGAPEVISGQAVRLPALTTTAKENGADIVILDTAPNADQTASQAARIADLVLIPCRPSTFDLEAIETTLLLTKAAKKPAYVVLNAVPPPGVALVKRHQTGFKLVVHKLPLISSRSEPLFGHSVIDGRTAQEFEPAGKAAEEITVLFSWLCGIVDMPTRGHDQKAA